MDTSEPGPAARLWPADRVALDAAAAAAGSAVVVAEGPPTIEAVIGEMARIHGLLPEDLSGRSRRRQFVEARQQAMWLARWVLGLSYPAIGRALGRDHSTVMYGVRQAEARRREDVLVRGQLAAAEQALGAPPDVPPPSARAYPAQWASICEQVLDRARDRCPRCECRGECGLWHRAGRCELRDDQEVLPADGRPRWRVALAVVALDGDPGNTDDANLRALCQPCRRRQAVAAPADGDRRRAGAEAV